MSKLSFKAIAAGCGISFLFGMISITFIPIYLYFIKEYGIPMENAYSNPLQYISYFTTAFIALSRILMGYVVAKISKEYEVLNGFATGITIFLLGNSISYLIIKKHPFEQVDFMQGYFIILSFVEIFIGVYIWIKIKEKKLANQSTFEQDIENLGNSTNSHE